MSLVLNFFWPVRSPWSVPIQVWYLVLHKYLALGLYETHTQGVCVNTLNFGGIEVLHHHIPGPFSVFQNSFPIISAAHPLSWLPYQLSSAYFITESNSILYPLHCSSRPPHTHCAYLLSLEMHLHMYTYTHRHTHTHTHTLSLSLLAEALRFEYFPSSSSTCLCGV